MAFMPMQDICLNRIVWHWTGVVESKSGVRFTWKASQKDTARIRRRMDRVSNVRRAKRRRELEARAPSSRCFITITREETFGVSPGHPEFKLLDGVNVRVPV